MALTVSKAVDECTALYIRQIDPNNMPTPVEMESELLQCVADRCAMHNAGLGKDSSEKVTPPKTLTPWQIAQLMLCRYRVARISSGNGHDPDLDPVGIYMDDGPDAGLYVISEDTLKRKAAEFDRTAGDKKLEDVLKAVKREAPSVMVTTNRDLIPVENGVYDYAAKSLRPFSPDLVFLSKSPIPYEHGAPLAVIQQDDGSTWDVESWLRSLSDDPEIVSLLWQLLGAAIRPGVRWNKAAFLFSDRGENGKGTFCELLRALVGDSHCASIPLAKFAKDFELEPLLRASAIVTDENAVGDFTADASGFKAVVTGDVLQVNRKFKTPVSFAFRGLVVECCNELPKTRDKSDSFYRRQLFVPFSKCFTGVANRAIKDDYVRRPEVLRYVLAHILDDLPQFYALSEPKACTALLDEFKEYNDPVRQFLADIVPELRWDLVPFTLLHELYKEWAKRANPSGQIEGRNTFVNHVASLAPMLDGWTCDKNRQIRVNSTNMAGPEPLIYAYEVRDWYRRGYSGNDPEVISTPNPTQLRTMYTGLARKDVQDVEDLTA